MSAPPAAAQPSADANGAAAAAHRASARVAELASTTDAELLSFAEQERRLKLAPQAQSKRKGRGGKARGGEGPAAAASVSAAAAVAAIVPSDAVPAVAHHTRSRDSSRSRSPSKLDAAGLAHLLGGAVPAATSRRQRRSKQATAAVADVHSGDEVTSNADALPPAAAAAGGFGSALPAASASSAFHSLALSRTLLQPEKERPIPNKRALRTRTPDGQVAPAAAAAPAYGAAINAAAAAGSPAFAAAPAPAAAVTLHYVPLSAALSAACGGEEEEDEKAAEEEEQKKAAAAAAPKSGKKGGRASKKQKGSNGGAATAAAASGETANHGQDIRTMFQAKPKSAAKKGATAAEEKQAPVLRSIEAVAAPAPAAAAVATPAAAAPTPRKRARVQSRKAETPPTRVSPRSRASPIVLDGDDDSDAAAASELPAAAAAVAAMPIRSSSVASVGSLSSETSVSSRASTRRTRAAVAAAAGDDSLPAASKAATRAAQPVAPVPPQSAAAFSSRSRRASRASSITVLSPPASSPSATPSAGCATPFSDSTQSSVTLSSGPAAAAPAPVAAAAPRTRKRRSSAKEADNAQIAAAAATAAVAAAVPAVAAAVPLDASCSPASKKQRLDSPSSSVATSPSLSGLSGADSRRTSPLAAASSVSPRGKSRSSAKQACGTCGLTTKGRWVMCDRCEIWYHFACQGLSKNAQKDIKSRSWACKSCEATPAADAAPTAAATAAAAAPAAAAAAVAKESVVMPPPVLGLAAFPVGVGAAAMPARSLMLRPSSVPAVQVAPPLLPPRPLPLPVSSRSPSPDDDESMDACAMPVPILPPLTSQPSLLQRCNSDAPTPRITARSFADQIPSSSVDVADSDELMLPASDADAIVDAEAAAVAAQPSQSSIERSLSTAETPIHLSQDDENEVSMDSPPLPHLPTSIDEDARSGGVSPLPPQASISIASNLSRSSTLVTKVSLQVNGEYVEAANMAQFSTAAAAAAAVAVDGTAVEVFTSTPPSAAALAQPTRTPNTLQRSHAMAAPARLSSPGGGKRKLKQMGGAAAAAQKRLFVPHYDMSADLRERHLSIVNNPLFPFRAHVGAAGCCGYFRRVNQDRFVCELKRLTVGGQPDVLVMGVADGHGILGHEAAAVCERELGPLLLDALMEGAEMEEALRRTIASLHEHINDTARNIKGVAPQPAGAAAATPVAPHAAEASSNGGASTPVRRSSRTNGSSPARSPAVPAAGGGLQGADYGTTIVVCVIQGRNMWIANVGDSRAVLFQRELGGGAAAASAAAASSQSSVADDWQIAFVTKDHNTDCASEKARVQAEGGALFDTRSEFRVYPDSMTFDEARSLQLTINMTRSLGHIKLGLHGISALPDIRSFELHAGLDYTIVLGSDGLFDVVDELTIRDRLVKAKPEQVQQSARELLEMADHRWQCKSAACNRAYGDNVTAVVAKITNIV